MIPTCERNPGRLGAGRCRPDSDRLAAPQAPRLLILGFSGVLTVIVVALTIGLASGGSSPQGAARLVPADALGFVDVSLDSRRGAVSDVLTMARRFPDFGHLSADVGARLGAILSGGRSVDLATQILPWAGHEAALALLNTTTATAGSLIVLDVRDRSRALAFIRNEGAGAAGTYRGAPLYAYRSGSELALVSHFLLAGQDASVRAAIDVASGAAPSLGASTVYQRARPERLRLAGRRAAPALAPRRGGRGSRRLALPARAPGRGPRSRAHLRRSAGTDSQRP